MELSFKGGGSIVQKIVIEIVIEICSGGSTACAENHDWKLIFISRGHVLGDWQWWM